MLSYRSNARLDNMSCKGLALIVSIEGLRFTAAWSWPSISGANWPTWNLLYWVVGEVVCLSGSSSFPGS